MGIEEAILKEVREQSLEQGIEKGIDQEKQLSVIRGFENGVAVELIAKIVDLSLDEVKRIIASYINNANQELNVNLAELSKLELLRYGRRCGR